MSELDQLRQEAEQLKNQIRVSSVPVGLKATAQMSGHLGILRTTGTEMMHQVKCFHNVKVNVVDM